MKSNNKRRVQLRDAQGVLSAGRTFMERMDSEEKTRLPIHENGNNINNDKRSMIVKEEEDIFSGTYVFEKYDDKLEDFLDSLGLPGNEYGNVVRTCNLKVCVKQPSFNQTDKRWTVTHYELADGVETSSNVTFELDKPYTTQRNGNDEITVCSKPQENTLLYQSKVPSKGWWIENLTIFTKEGITSFVKNVNKNVITTKYYTRAPN